MQVESAICEGAYEALFLGDVETHDRIGRHTIIVLMSRNEVVLLAQASMARVVELIPAKEQVVPILSSPRLAVERLKHILH